MADWRLDEVADVLNVTVDTLRKKARLGVMPGAYKFGGQWRVRDEAMRALRGGSAEKPVPKIREPRIPEELPL